MINIITELADLRTHLRNVRDELASVTASLQRLRGRPIVLTGPLTIRAAADQPLPPMAAAMLRRHGLTASATAPYAELSAAMRAAGMKPEDRMIVIRSIERAALGLPA